MLDEIRTILFSDKTFLLLIGIVGLVLVAGVVRVVYGTKVRDKWGMNSSTIRCPRCQAAIPQFRIPNNVQEFMWGGHTCASCGAQFDKWGRELVRPTP